VLREVARKCSNLVAKGQEYLSTIGVLAIHYVGSIIAGINAKNLVDFVTQSAIIVEYVILINNIMLSISV